MLFFYLSAISLSASRGVFEFLKLSASCPIQSEWTVWERSNSILHALCLMLLAACLLPLASCHMPPALVDFFKIKDKMTNTKMTLPTLSNCRIFK